MTDYRIEEANKVRIGAARMAADRAHPAHQANGDEERYAIANYAMNFTKGLSHNADDWPYQRRGRFRGLPLGDRPRAASTPSPPRCARPRPSSGKWEAPTAGVVYDLQGPDAQAVTMPPAHRRSVQCELAYEMAEVYEFALLRDVPLTEFADGAANGESPTRRPAQRHRLRHYWCEGVVRASTAPAA